MFTKKVLLLMFAVSVLILVPVSLLSAHELEVNENIGAILHIDPQDDPVIGQPATFFLEFKDKQNKFKLEDCDCQAVIKKGEQEVFRQAMASPSFVYTFPEQGTYILSIEGETKPSAQSQDFLLTYEIPVTRVAPPQDANQNPSNDAQAITTNSWKTFVGSHNLHFILFGIAFVVMGLLYLKDKRKAKNISPTDNE